MNHKAWTPARGAAWMAAPLAMAMITAPAARAQSESVAPGTGDVSGPAAGAISNRAAEVLSTLKLDRVLSMRRVDRVAQFDATRGADPARRTATQRVQLGRFLISTNRASTRFVPLATQTPRAAVFLAQRAAPTLQKTNAAARLGEALASYRQLALYARLSADDIADAMTLAALLSYRNATGRALDIFSDDSNRQPRDQELVRAVRDQMRNMVRHDPDLQGMDAPQKRFVAETQQMLAALCTMRLRDASATAKRQRDARLIFQFVTGRETSQVRLSGSGFSPAPR